MERWSVKELELMLETYFCLGDKKENEEKEN